MFAEKDLVLLHVLGYDRTRRQIGDTVEPSHVDHLLARRRMFLGHFLHDADVRNATARLQQQHAADVDVRDRASTLK
jgi:hypothetical protein